MEMQKYLLAHDLGTSGNKATLFTIDGQLIKSSVSGYKTHYFEASGMIVGKHPRPLTTITY